MLLKENAETEDRVCIAIRPVRQVEESTSKHGLGSRIIILIKEAEQKRRTESCALHDFLGCNSSTKIEEHHLAGRRNFPDTLSTCINCHQNLSELQLKWLESTKNKLASYLFGWSDIFLFLWMRTDETFYRLLSKKFTYQAFDYLRKDG